MARHRSDSSPTGGVPRPSRHRPAGGPPTGGLPTTGRTDGAARHRSDPDTTPLDLAAIAVAAATARLRVSDEDRATPPAPRTPSGPLPTQASAAATVSTPAPATSGPATSGPATSGPATTGPVPPAPAMSGPATGSHRAPAPARAMLGRVLRPTQAASALALVGAIAGAGVAAAGGGTVLAGPEPADTGELRLPSSDPTVTGEQVAPAGLQSAARAVTSPTTTSTARSSTPKTTAPRRPAAPTPAVRPASDGRTLWSADFAGSGLGNFKSTPWNNQGAKAPTVAGGLVNFSMPGGGKRSEIEPDFKSLDEGDEYYFGFTVKLADDFPVDTSDWQVITQFKNDGTGSPPLEVKVQDGHFVLDGGSGAFSKVIGDAKPGQSTHLALKVKFSSSDGRVSAWQDGAQKITDFAPPGGTLYEGKSSYVKTGIYRDTSIDQAGKLSFGSWAIGTGLGAVGENARAGAAKD